MAKNIKIIDKGWSRIIKDYKKLNNTKIEIGLFGSGPDPKDNPAYLGLIQNSGANIQITDKMRKFLHAIGIHVRNETLYIVIPKRPFMSEAFDKELNKLVNFIVSEYGKVVDGKQTLNFMIDRIGVKHENQIKTGIRKYNWKTTHPATIEGKGSSTPLIDNGQMRNSIKYKVVSR